MTARLVALALAGLLAAAGARAEDGPSVQATLHTRFTDLGNATATDVRFDRATSAFDLSGYLTPSRQASYGSAFASFALDGGGLGGDLRWRLALDTGELRSQAFPRRSTVCWTELGSGLTTDVPAGCALYTRPVGLPVPRIFSVDDTRDGPAQLTSNGRTIEDELRATLFVREAYGALSFGRAGFATLRVGRKRVSVADGFVYDDYATGAELALDVGAIGPPLELTLSLFQPTRDFPSTVKGISPFVAARVDWLPSLFENAGVFVAAYRDRTGSVAELFRSTLVERFVMALDEAATERQILGADHLLAAVLDRDLSSDATLAWAGTSGRLTPWKGHRIGWTAALLGGRIEHVATANAAIPDIARDVTVRGRLLSLRWETSLSGRLGLGASFLHLSGGVFPVATPGQGAATGTYGGFLGIAPFVTATNLFFAGGLSETFADRQSSAPGVNGRGVSAPGLSVVFDPVDSLGLALKGAYLVAPVAGPFGGRVYGTEVDGSLSWAIREWLVAGAELDVLFPGDFYGGRQTIYKTVLALDFLTP